MAIRIDRNGVQRLVRDGALLVEVLPRKAWETLHLTGARSAPLGDIDEEWGRGVARDRPIIVYCASHE